ncbi:MscS protein [Bibersteinia trehalosi USDA-ARS-USMARC-188]|uniref:Small-conductance mechanosensitive channel n=6 Tax=Bibersteinia trehalosi TaxID=47735 RepID=W0R3A6_BIBTR|nr:mechanosensitive ion channel domain-containing protein [Bibersteinia trehalosi]AGH37673.1 MscS protein [Bibersteinia trehalosi USDA-ARS-USMARC-192]AHG82518.1 MscS protein [Bibersteinia trehalosi USDA-ARS-USMARC-188]AHG84852.1 MscS protein [Bibersteinia trehalosi USDA-ARS-USMARC-189]AHG85664.1 MscS protein [Bibersteinia trehalosi USDA-ARS-USMARC-190]OAQ15759.1 mechanosensitive ion channel protein [Bibersteinia trehalosi Y31]
MSEPVEQAAAELDLQAEAVKIIETVENSSLESILQEWIIPYGTKLLLAIAIFFIGRYIARFVSRLLGKAVLASSKDEMLQSFVTSISYFLFLLITVIAALSQLGINTSSLVALIGAAGLAIGLALQNSMQNFAAGVMILIFKPFKKGDFIEAADVAGKVEQMGLLMLELRTNDNKTILVPNGKVFADSITNYSRNEIRRIDFIFDISYDSDIAQAKQIIERVFAEDENVLDYPEASVAVGALASSSVQLFARPWVRTNQYVPTQFALLEKVKLEFDKAGISIPYNQLDLHLPDNQSIKIETRP